MLSNSLEKRDDLVGEDLRCAEALRIQHDLGDELTVGLGHGQAPEQLLQVVWEVRPARVARVHGDEDPDSGDETYHFSQEIKRFLLGPNRILDTFYLNGWYINGFMRKQLTSMGWTELPLR